MLPYFHGNIVYEQYYYYTGAFVASSLSQLNISIIIVSSRCLLWSCITLHTRSTFSDKRFPAASLRERNNWPSCLRQDVSYWLFKWQLKTFLFGF